MYVAVAGNIGTGKTDLATLLSRYFGFELHLEDNDQNPYLLDFYADMPRWAHSLQVSFLSSRLQKLNEIRQHGLSVIQDRTIYEDAEIFAPNLQAMGLMSARDYESYIKLYETVASLVHPPDLLIYLRCDIGRLVEHIEARGRNYEQSIRFDYLKRLNERYDEWFERYNHGKKIEVQVPEKTFQKNPEALGNVISRVNAELFGLFSAYS